MGVLLDSHVILWLGDQPGKIGQRARQLMTDPGPAFVSAISHVEFAVKAMVGKLDTGADFAGRTRQRGLTPLPFTEAHGEAVRAFPELVGHDPFDRMLLAQAHAERMDFLTADRRLLALDRDWIIDARQ